MHSLELNKIAGALLGTLLFVMALGIIADGFFARHKLEKAGYALAGFVDSHGAGQAAAAAPDTPLPVLLAKADAKKGEGAAKVCTTCHTLEKGGADKPTGPNLAGVVGRKMGSTGYAYSDGMKGMGNEWTYENLNKFLTNPKSLVASTKMSYAGERDPAKRADLIAFLRTISDGAPPFPTP